MKMAGVDKISAQKEERSKERKEKDSGMTEEMGEMGRMNERMK